MSKSRYVITITRQFGSMGRPIAKKIAENLGIEYYDRDLIDMAARKLGLAAEEIGAAEESASQIYTNAFERMAYPLGTKATAVQDQIFETQKNIIRFLAEKDTCVIVGRCADFVLYDMDNTMNVYIYAQYEARLKHAIEDLGLTEEEARRTIARVDKARENYHLNYAGFRPDDKKFKDILIDSSFLGIEQTAAYLTKAVKLKFGK